VIWLLASLGVLLALALSVLVPRVRFTGEYNRGTLIFEIVNHWFRVTYNSTAEQVKGRILLFHFKRDLKDESAKPEKSEAVVDIKIGIGKKPEESSEKTSEKTKHKTTVSISLIKDSRLAKELLFSVIRLVFKLLRSFRIDYLRSNVIIATSDPYTTAMVYGSVQPFMAFHSPPKRVVAFGVDFESQKPVWNIAGSISTRPIRVLWLILIWALRLPWLRIWRARKRV
jgi:hypothetical protein